MAADTETSPCLVQASLNGNPASGRTSLPEIVYAPGKSPAQITAVMREFCAAVRVVLAVRVSPDVAAAVTHSLPDAVYNQPARTLRCVYKGVQWSITLKASFAGRQPLVTSSCLSRPARPDQ